MRYVTVYVCVNMTNSFHMPPKIEVLHTQYGNEVAPRWEREFYIPAADRCTLCCIPTPRGPTQIFDPRMLN
jgi:hypothetical protein